MTLDMIEDFRGDARAALRAYLNSDGQQAAFLLLDLLCDMGIASVSETRAPIVPPPLTKGEVEVLIDNHDQTAAAARSVGQEPQAIYHEARRDLFKTLLEAMKHG